MNAMNFAPGYLVVRFFYRIFEFLRHWYVKSIRWYSNAVLDRLQDIDRSLAWRITFKNLFEPLYKDYSIIGYFFGFLFRLFRLIMGGLIYIVIFALALVFYLAWLALPAYLVFRVIHP